MIVGATGAFLFCREISTSIFMLISLARFQAPYTKNGRRNMRTAQMSRKTRSATPATPGNSRASSSKNSTNPVFIEFISLFDKGAA